MFGIGMPEMVIVALLALLVFGPTRLPAMARDLGRFVNEARGWVEEFKEEIYSEGEGGQGPPSGRRELGGDAGSENVGPEEGPGREGDAAVRPRASRASRGDRP